MTYTIIIIETADSVNVLFAFCCFRRTKYEKSVIFAGCNCRLRDFQVGLVDFSEDFCYNDTNRSPIERNYHHDRNTRTTHYPSARWARYVTGRSCRRARYLPSVCLKMGEWSFTWLRILQKNTTLTLLSLPIKMTSWNWVLRDRIHFLDANISPHISLWLVVLCFSRTKKHYIPAFILIFCSDIIMQKSSEPFNTFG